MDRPLLVKLLLITAVVCLLIAALGAWGVISLTHVAAVAWTGLLAWAAADLVRALSEA